MNRSKQLDMTPRVASRHRAPAVGLERSGSRIVEMLGPGRRICFLSDTHMHWDRLANSFPRSDEEFEAELYLLLDENDLVVALGDIFELDHGLLPARHSHELSLVRQAFPHSSEILLRHPRVLLVRGNHDPDVSHIDRLEIHTDHGRICAAHGHTAICAIQAYPEWLVGMIRRSFVLIGERQQIQRNERVVGHLLGKLTSRFGLPMHDIQCQVDMARLEMSRCPDLVAVVNGHYHRFHDQPLGPSCHLVITPEYRGGDTFVVLDERGELVARRPVAGDERVQRSTVGSCA